MKAVLLLLLVGCASTPRKPTYFECEQECKWEFDYDATETGQRPVGLEWDGEAWSCQCAPETA